MQLPILIIICWKLSNHFWMYILLLFYKFAVDL